MSSICGSAEIRRRSAVARSWLHWTWSRKASWTATKRSSGAIASSRDRALAGSAGQPLPAAVN